MSESGVSIRLPSPLQPAAGAVQQAVRLACRHRFVAVIELNGAALKAEDLPVLASLLRALHGLQFGPSAQRIVARGLSRGLLRQLVDMAGKGVAATAEPAWVQPQMNRRRPFLMDERVRVA